MNSSSPSQALLPRAVDHVCRTECRTLVWGGTGQPTYSAEGRCSCICEDSGWSDRNMLGRASCVPDMVHKVFGWVGVVISMGLLCHAAYHLRRQVKFHEEHMSASSSPVERCRRQLHTQTIMAAALSTIYYILVLGDALRWCAAVMALAGAPSYVGGSVLAARMWAYTNDPRLLRESPRAVAISGGLERPVGNIAACCIATIAPILAAFLALLDFTEISARLLLLGGNLVGVVTMVSFVIFGRALLETIDKSLQNQQKHLQQQTPITAEGGQVRKWGEGAGNQTLLEARRKVRTVLLVNNVATVYGILFALSIMISGVDLDMPLVMYGTLPVGCVMWLAFNIRVHGGRSGSYGRLASPMSSPMPRGQRSTMFSCSRPSGQGRSTLFSKQEQVVPTDTALVHVYPHRESPQ